jgi:hypothetical protein
MSQRLSTSVTFQQLEERVTNLEAVSPLAATLENNTYLSAKTQAGLTTRIAGITPNDDLYLGGIDVPLNSVLIEIIGSTSLGISQTGVEIIGLLNITDQLHAPILFAPSGNGSGGTVKILGSSVSGYTGILEFHKLDGVRNGFVGFNPEAGAMQYGSDTNAGHNFSGGPITLDDANIGIKRNGADPVYLCDANDYLTYNRSADKFVFVIGGVAVASIDASGNMRLKGTLIQSTTP